MEALVPVKNSEQELTGEVVWRRVNGVLQTNNHRSLL